MSPKQLKTCIIASAALLAAAVGGALWLFAGRGTAVSEEEAPRADRRPCEELLRAVPSDAAAVKFGGTLSDAVEAMPSSPLIDLPLGSLKDATVAVSFHCLGSVTPLVVCEAGKNGKRPEDLDNLLAKALEYGITTRFFPSSRRSGRHNILLLSVSEGLVAASERNIEENASILDIDGFSQALQTVKSGTGEHVAFRTDAAGTLLPNRFLDKYFSRTILSRFLAGTAGWIVLRQEAVEPSGNGEYVTFDVTAVTGGDPKCYLRSFDGLQAGESRVIDLLPHRTSLVLDLCPASFSEWNKVHEEYLDANSRLVSRNVELKEVRGKKKVSPLEWAASLDIREVARVYWPGGQVLLVRPAKTQVAHNTRHNPNAGYLAPLFGNAFKLQDESSCACIGHWMVYGSAESVKRFIASERRILTPSWPSRGARFVVLADDVRVWNTRQGTKLQIYRSN